MIFLTVGTQMPFDRLVAAVDAWAARQPGLRVVAQVAGSREDWKHLETVSKVSVDQFRQLVDDASLIIAHAGLGSIITALENGKPIVIMPRRSDLGEHRNDHQLATARKFVDYSAVSVAFDTDELERVLEDLDSLVGSEAVEPSADEDLLEAIRSFIAE